MLISRIANNSHTHRTHTLPHSTTHSPTPPTPPTHPPYLIDNPLRPDLEQCVPAARAERLARGADSHAADAVLVALQLEAVLVRAAAQHVPAQAVVVVVAREEHAARAREGHRGDATHDVVGPVLRNLYWC